ncbi:MAG: HEAT repeat domain-containing protein, partial [Candidatus Lokiarchaeota archaeon]|nr:HEAT repeat domain-containing protein [Candidatus Lokiarchaeota archaeon]
IGELKLQSYLPEVIKLIDDDDPSVRFAVCKTLKIFLKDDIVNLNHIIKNNILICLIDRNSRENNLVIKKTIQRLISNYFNV